MDFVDVLDKYFENKMRGKSFARLHYAELTSLTPVTFYLEDDEIELKEELLVVPKYRPFVTSDIGKKFVLMSNDDGQTYFYLYEASQPQGSNGVPYSFEGTFEGRLVGTCPDGQVVVTSGTISKLTHNNKVGD